MKRWEHQERRWPRLRWLCLAAGVALTLASAALLIWFAEFSMNSDVVSMSLVVSWVSPICWLCFLGSCGVLGFTLANWHGNLKTRLLLRLIAEQERQAA
jgi:peptidoglycan biosynthesis protein MviN/MurJ (putative lipid II flippase)